MIDAGSRESFIRAHLPGALLTPFRGDMKSDLSPASILSPSSALDLFSTLSIRSDTPYMVYDTGEVLPSARLAFILRYYGVKDVSILSGGMTSYLHQGGRVHTGYGDGGGPPGTGATAKASEQAPPLMPSPHPSMLTGWEAVMQAAATSGGAQIIDCRSPAEFSGADTKGFPRGGHIPRAISVPWGAVVSPGSREFLSGGSLRAHFESKGVDLARPAIVLCLAGVRASAVFAALQAAGGTGGVTLYEGSMAEWLLKPELPVERLK